MLDNRLPLSWRSDFLAVSKEKCLCVFKDCVHNVCFALLHPLFSITDSFLFVKGTCDTHIQFAAFDFSKGYCVVEDYVWGLVARQMITTIIRHQAILCTQ